MERTFRHSLGATVLVAIVMLLTLVYSLLIARDLLLGVIGATFLYFTLTLAQLEPAVYEFVEG